MRPVSVRLTAPVVVALLVVGFPLPGSNGVPFFEGRARAQALLPPVSYICPMDADIVEPLAGRCPTCKMDLEPVRLDLAWSCPNHAAVITGKAGACPVDRRELVQVTVSKYWTCVESGKTHLLDPGTCANGQPRKLEQSVRAHGDHNPRHGGQFFMAADKWHHLEGTYPRAGLFRVHFYDNFTKAFSARGFSGRLVTREENDREIESVPLRVSRDGLTMEAGVARPSTPTKDLPLRVSTRLAFKPGEPEQRFDFAFTEITTEPKIVPASRSNPAAISAVRPVPTPTPIPTPASAGSRADAGGSPVPRAAAAAAAATGLVAATAAPPTAAALPAMIDCSPTMSRLDAVAFGQSLPRASGELLRLLSLCSVQVGTLIKDGQYGFVYQPSILSKDVAIALEDTLAELPSRQRAQVSSAIRRVVLAAWMLDLYGDQGNQEKLTESYETFAAAVADIKTAYGANP